jgi:hypothetical protein
MDLLRTSVELGLFAVQVELDELNRLQWSFFQNQRASVALKNGKHQKNIEKM